MCKEGECYETKNMLSIKKKIKHLDDFSFSQMNDTVFH